MEYIDLHAHMISRSTDDYVNMAMTGCVAVTEPAFWAGWDRSSADGFEDYFRQLTEFEPKRAAQYGIRHFAWICMNPKEGDDRAMAAGVLARIPKFLERPTVRSEEHTSELQSRQYLVCRLLLEKKNK